MLMRSIFVFGIIVMTGCGLENEAKRENRTIADRDAASQTVPSTIPSNNSSDIISGMSTTPAQTVQTEPVTLEQFSQIHEPFFQLFKDTPDSSCIAQEDLTSFQFAKWPEAMKKFLAVELYHFPLLNLLSGNKLNGIYLIHSGTTLDYVGLTAYCRSAEDTYVLINMDHYQQMVNGFDLTQVMANADLNYLAFELISTLIHELTHVVDMKICDVDSLIYAIKSSAGNPPPDTTPFFNERMSIVNLSWNVNNGFHNNAMVPKFSANDINSNFVSEYSRTDITEDLAETIMIYFTSTRYDLKLPNASSSAAQKQKICQVVTVLFQNIGKITEDCQKCLDGACGLAQSPIYQTKSVRENFANLYLTENILIR